MSASLPNARSFGFTGRIMKRLRNIIARQIEDRHPEAYK
jgi:hypothetical protein